MRWSPLTAVVAATLLVAGLGSPRAVFAQRAEENVTTSSEDAFGRSIGNESIGIYNEEDVRDFSPIEAGNVRLEGLYFDRLGTLTSRLVEGSTIRVGIAAQSYPFPSPTGIVDYDLRRVGASQVVSALVNYGPFGGRGAEVDAQVPVGSARQYSVATAEYRFAGTGASIDSTVEHVIRQVANSDNTLEVPARAVLHIGGRYRFKMFDKPVTLRLLVQNVSDEYGWRALSSGAYIYNAPRRFTAYITADL